MLNQEAASKRIFVRIARKGKGSVFTPKDFLDLAGHETVRQALARLTKAGKLRRLIRGVYEYPEYSRLLQGLSGPDPDAIARAIARTHGWTIVPTGETALNRLGISTQVPSRWQYLSDGPTKSYRWAGGTIVLRHRANKETTRLSPSTATVVQALKALGPTRVDDGVMEKLRAALEPAGLSRAVREARYATSWVYEVIKRLAGPARRAHALYRAPVGEGTT